jgi:hypothetical protein
MKYHDGHEVTCGVFDLFCCVDIKILGEELEYYFETVLNSDCLLIGKSSNFDYC